MSEEPTPEQIAASERAMDGLEAQADLWADEIDLVLIVKNIGQASRGLNDRMPADVREGFINRQEANIDALARQAYLEGFMRGGDSRKDYDAARVKEAIDKNEELEQLFDLQHEADMRAVKRWREAHPDKPLTMPDRCDMVVWLMEELARSSEQAAQGWQPIETAPKDGTTIDLWAAGNRIPDAYWGRPEHSCGEYGQHCDCCPDYDGWCDVFGYVTGSEGWSSKEPTHWVKRPIGPPVSGVKEP